MPDIKRVKFNYKETEEIIKGLLNRVRAYKYYYTYPAFFLYGITTVFFLYLISLFSDII